MITLDCESKDFTLKSLSCIYGVPEMEIEVFLKETDMDKHCSEHDLPHTADIELTILFERAVGCAPSTLERVCWFHLTRAKSGSDFRSGILPLNEALPGIWDTILDIFKGSKHEEPLLKLRKEGVPNHQYTLKVGNPLL